jgi:hypothetical protein
MYCIYKSKIKGIIGYVFLHHDNDIPKKEFYFKNNHPLAEQDCNEFIKSGEKDKNLVSIKDIVIQTLSITDN